MIEEVHGHYLDSSDTLRALLVVTCFRQWLTIHFLWFRRLDNEWHEMTRFLAFLCHAMKHGESRQSAECA